MTRGIKQVNEYAAELGRLYDETPKAVFAAIAVSLLTCGGDRMDEASTALREEWEALHQAGIVPQRPPNRDQPGDEAVSGR